MAGTLAAVALGAVFLFSAVTKLAAPAQWRAQSANLLAVPGVAVTLPYVEAALGALLVAGWQRTVVAAAAAVVLVAFTVLLVVRFSQGRRPPCACFGALSARPIGWGHVLRNAVFIALAVVAVAA